MTKTNQPGAVGVLVAILWATGAFAAQRPFTAADSIAMTHIMDPHVAWIAYRPLDFNWSPDRRWAAMVTRRGDLASGLNHYELRVFSERELKDILRANRSPARPPGQLILTMATSTPKHGIEKISWDPGGRFLHCIGRDGERPGQVYEVALDGSGHRPLTAHETDVATYVVTNDRQRVLYTATDVQDWTGRNRRGYVVGAELAAELAMRDPRDLFYRYAHYLLDLQTKTIRKLDLPASTAWGREYSVSPDGRHALYPVQVHVLPAEWRDYEFFRQNQETADRALAAAGSATAPIASVRGLDPTFGVAPWTAQYHLIDLGSGSSSPLFDAPALVFARWEIEWSRDSKSVIVSDSFLPTHGVSEKEADHRRSVRIIAEVDLTSGAVSPIADQPDLTPDGRRLDLQGIERLADGSMEIRWRSKLTNETVERYIKQGGGWSRGPDRPNNLRPSGVSLEIRQDMNTPPDVFVVDRSNGRSVRITDLNPQLRELTLGKVQPFDWKDKFGRRFQGGLFFPPNYVPGRRLPVVLQTYGFRQDEFVVDGPNSMPNGYAARALVNQNLLVLQMPELEGPTSSGPGEFQETGENPRYLAGLEAAIDALDRAGYIDPSKVGLIGFSREGLHGQYAVTFSSRPIAAAVLSDFASVTPMGYALIHALPLPGATEFEHDGLVGASFWGGGIDLWRERSPLFHLDRIRTPIRLEAIGFSVPGFWDMYMILTRHRRPVELVRIPREDHPFQTPWGRFTSQQGSVDWFAFWLNGVEDPDPAKKEQYERWRIFRQQQAIAAKTPPVRSTTH